MAASSAEQWAFGCLLATAGSIAFSIALGQFCAGVAFLTFVVALTKRQVRFRMPGVAWLWVAFVVVAVATSWHAGGGHGLWKRTGKLLWFVLIPVAASLVRRPDRARKVLWAFLIGCVVLGLKDLIWEPLRAWRAPTPDYLTSLIDKGSMTDGQMLMLGLVAGVVMLLVPLKEGRRPSPWLWGMLAIQAAGLLINFKRGSWFCAAILAGLALLTQLRWRAWVMLLLLTTAFFALPPVQTRMGQLRREFDSDGGGRLTMWCRVVPYLIRAHPEGVGYGCLTNEMMRQAHPKVERDRNHVHANWGQVLVETGWLGLGIYLLWMGKALVDGVRGIGSMRTAAWKDRALGVAVLMMFVGLLLNGLVEYNFGDTELMFIYAVLMGLAVARPDPASGLS